ncbi:transposase [Rickettsiella massiliensis]|uniref:transposase n=1 Tax=Rickettsiella massiliensis TaxID=676517 RepID=UPI00178C6BD5
MPPKRIKGYFEYENYRNRSKHEKTELINAVFYLTRTGFQWHQLPNNFPPGKRRMQRIHMYRSWL